MFGEPNEHHAWLQQLLGEWTYEGSCDAGPGNPPMKSSGTERVRALGPFWVIAEGTGKGPDGKDATSIMTIGYDPLKNGYAGTWVGSMMPYLWVYKGSMDDARRVLTLASDGPSMTGEGMQRYEDIVEIVSPTHRRLRGRVQGADGQWNEFMQTDFHRKG